MKFGVFWDVLSCSQVVLTDVSEVRTASIIRAMRLHGNISQKTLNFRLVQVVLLQTVRPV
jgi:hypothetical protein